MVKRQLSKPEPQPPGNFCGVGNYGVLIPLADLQNLLNLAQSVPEILETVKRMDERNAAMRTQYSELLQKVGEIERSL